MSPTTRHLPVRRGGRLGDNMDDGQVELALRPVQQVQLQPTGHARREGADDEGCAARVLAQLVGDRLQRVRVPDGGRAIPTLVRGLDARELVLVEVEVHRPTLDDVFLSLTGRSLRDQADAA